MREYCELHERIEVVRYQYIRDGERTNIFRCEGALIPEVDYDLEGCNIEDWYDLVNEQRLVRSDYVLAVQN